MKRKTGIKFISLLIAAALYLGVFVNYAAAQTGSTNTTISSADLDSAWNAAAATKITLNRTSITVDGSGARVNGNTVTITAAGTYVASGALTNGQIAITAAKKDTVRLVLNGVNITNATGAPVYASQCDKLIVTLARGSQNTLTDGGSRFTYTNTAGEEPNAALFSKNDLSINGTGALTVNAGFNNGIGTKDDLIIASGTITVNAANHGIKGNDSVTVLDGNFKITAGKDGVQTSNDTNAAKGWVDIRGGSFEITAADDGIHAESKLYISGGTIKILKSYEGLEGQHVYISGGVLNVTASDDGINASGGNGGRTGNYSLNISGGHVTVLAGNDGLDSNGAINISGGTVVTMTKTNARGRGTGPIDADGAVTFTGGTIIYGGTAAGGNPGGASTQSYVYTDAVISANSNISVKKNGKTLITFTPNIDCRYLALSSPDIVNGANYEIYNGSTLIASAVAGTGGGMNGMNGGGRRQGQRIPQ